MEPIEKKIMVFFFFLLKHLYVTAWSLKCLPIWNCIFYVFCGPLTIKIIKVSYSTMHIRIIRIRLCV